MAELGMHIIPWILAATLVAAAVGCGDDDGDTPPDARDAGTDAGHAGRRHPADAGDHVDGRVPPHTLPDAGDAGDAAACDLEPSYIWADVECDVPNTLRIARRVTLE